MISLGALISLASSIGIIAGIIGGIYFFFTLLGGLAEMGIGLLVLVVGCPIVWWRGRKIQRDEAARWKLDVNGMPYRVEYDHDGIEILQ